MDLVIVIEPPLRGPVHTVRVKIAFWDHERKEWSSPDFVQLETHNPDGSTASRELMGPAATMRHTFVYDEGGRLLETQAWYDDRLGFTLRRIYDSAGRLAEIVGVAPDGATQLREQVSYDVFGRRTRVRFVPEPAGMQRAGFPFQPPLFDPLPVPDGGTLTVRHDDEGRPVEELGHNAVHELVSRRTYAYDREGRLLQDETWIMPDSTRQHDGDVIPDEGVPGFTDGLLSSSTYAYDASGRLVERRGTYFGGRVENLVRFRYDDGGFLVEYAKESVERVPAASSADDQNRRFHQYRYEYRFDNHGNWIERVISRRDAPGADFVPAIRDRRAITYF